MDTKEAGKKGGNSTLKKYGVEHFRRIRKIVKKEKEKNEQGRENN